MLDPLRFSRRRRSLLRGAAASALCAFLPSPSRAAEGPSGLPELRGESFQLDLVPTPVNYTGVGRVATTINETVPGPVLRWRQGDEVALRVTNHLSHSSSLHWHGIILPTGMDGVPGLSFDGIAPGESFLYRFPLRQSGTYWYHSHSGFQEQTGMYGAIVIDPADGGGHVCERDYVVMLSDWTDERPEAVYARLKKESHYYNIQERVLGDLWSDARRLGWGAALADRAEWNRMRMSARDLLDVTGLTYTYLLNGRSSADPWRAVFAPGDRVKLRLINASAMTLFDVRVAGLPMTVVSSDGQPVRPVTVDELRIGAAETYDVVVRPDAGRAYALFAQAMDRSGYVHGEIAPARGPRPTVPEMDPVPTLSHMDMGMAGHGHGHGHASHADGGHAGHAVKGPMMGSGAPGYGSAEPVRHHPAERGVVVDMLAEDARYRLDDPGVGLRPQDRPVERRVLTYADLVNQRRTEDRRPPEREVQWHLTGNMHRYMWSVNGVRFSDAEPLILNYGERVRFTLVNDTMMNHPIHLHGLWSELETGYPEHIPRKHTVVVQPGAKISYLVTANARGRWAWHCHLLYHMPGMAREVRVV